MIDETALGYVAHYCSPLPWANFTYPQLYAISLEKEGAVKNNLKKIKNPNKPHATHDTVNKEIKARRLIRNKKKIELNF